MLNWYTKCLIFELNFGVGVQLEFNLWLCTPIVFQFHDILRYSFIPKTWYFYYMAKWIWVNNMKRIKYINNVYTVSQLGTRLFNFSIIWFDSASLNLKTISFRLWFILKKHMLTSLHFSNINYWSRHD